jgi:patatin-like phospholipase/acyl hydrolase
MLVVMSIWGTRKKQQIADERDDRYILCIDGGGMRGVVPAVLLGKLARLLQDAGDERPFYAHFDLIAGTSTGGLLALALAAPACVLASTFPQKSVGNSQN